MPYTAKEWLRVLPTLPDELIEASGMRLPCDEDPPEPPAAMQVTLAAAIAACALEIQRATPAVVLSRRWMLDRSLVRGSGLPTAGRARR